MIANKRTATYELSFDPRSATFARLQALYEKAATKDDEWKTSVNLGSDAEIVRSTAGGRAYRFELAVKGVVIAQAYGVLGSHVSVNSAAFERFMEQATVRMNDSLRLNEDVEREPARRQVA